MLLYQGTAELSDLSKLDFKLAILCIAEIFPDPKRLGKRLPNEGHGFRPTDP
jgi:hypothetical protein